MEESENIRNNIDFSFKNNQKIFDKNDYLQNIYFMNSNFRKISKDLISNIIKARLDEIFEKLKKQLVITGFNLSSGIHFLLTGGGSEVSNIEKYFINFFGLNIKIQNKNTLEKDDSLEKNFASCLGAIKIIKDGWETEAIPENPGKNAKKTGFFAKIFGINK